jgi:hypothetical protein
MPAPSALTVTSLVKGAGTAVSLVAADTNGNTVPASDDIIIEVHNGDAGSHTVTLTSHATAGPGLATANIVVTVAAGATKRINLRGYAKAFTDPSDNKVHISYDAVTSVTVAAISVA